MYFGLFIFACVWWYSCKWFLVGLVIIGEKLFKKDTLPYNIFMFTFVGGGGLATIYLFIYLFLSIARGMVIFIIVVKHIITSPQTRTFLRKTNYSLAPFLLLQDLQSNSAFESSVLPPKLKLFMINS